MRIVYQSDGLNVHDYRFLAKLAQSEHDVILVTYRASGVPASITSLPGLRILRRPLFRFNVDWDTLDKGNSLIGVLSRRVGLLRAILDFRAKIHVLRPDVIHAGMVQTSGLMTALSGFRPFLLMPWGSDILVAPRRSPWHWLATQYVVRRAQMISCDCEAVKQVIVRLTGYPHEKIHVIPWGIDLHLFRPRPISNGLRSTLGWEGKKILIMTRNFEHVYGHRYFLTSLPEVIRAVPDTRVVLVGYGSLESQLRLQVERLGLTDHIYFAGKIENERLPEYLNEADIYISTSLSDGTSLSLLEAIACALPVVVTDVPANLEWIQDGENGFIVPRRDSSTLAQRLIQMLHHVVLRQEMRECNLVLARERADWDRNFGRIEELYETMAQ